VAGVSLFRGALRLLRPCSPSSQGGEGVAPSSSFKECEVRFEGFLAQVDLILVLRRGGPFFERMQIMELEAGSQQHLWHSHREESVQFRLVQVVFSFIGKCFKLRNVGVNVAVLHF
jgi:hypothetical protein